MRILNKSMLVILCFMFMMGVCSCKKEKKIVISTPKPTKEVQEKEKEELSKEENKEAQHKAVTTMNIDSAGEYITLVDIKNEDFWKSVVECKIDSEYNKETIDSGNIRQERNIDKEYEETWKKEIDETYKVLLEALSGNDKELLKKQKEAYSDFLSNTSSLYDKLFVVGSKNDKMAAYKNITGSYKEKLNKYRRYAIELKEYYYLLDKGVYFTKTKEEKEAEANKNKATESKKDSESSETKKNEEKEDASKEDNDKEDKVEYEMELNKNDLNLVSNAKYLDMVNDNYKKKFEEFEKIFLKNDSEHGKGINEAEEAYNYWNDIVKKMQKELTSNMSNEQKSILEKQYNRWNDYVSLTEQLQNSILNNSKIFTRTYSEDVKYNVIMQKAYKAKLYALELLQYNYLTKGELEF